MVLSLGEGLEFLPFYRKGKKFNYPVNPVEKKIYIYELLLLFEGTMG